MAVRFEIHPRIGVARLGNSQTEFYLAPETTGGLPVECDEWGNIGPDTCFVETFKDATGAIKRQAARFRIFRYEDDGEGVEVTLVSDQIESITWTAHIANKKPIWHTFSELQGDLEFGEENSYANQHIPFNNPDVTKPSDRQNLILDPGPRSISAPETGITFSRYNIPDDYPHGSFPATDAGGQQIDVLGELRVNADGNLIALGGFGRVTGDAEITSFKGASGYWDDVSDGYVTAEVRLTDGSVHAVDSAWLLVGSPKYVPEVVNIVTLADTLDDVAIRNHATRPEIFVAGDNTAEAFTEPGTYTPLNGFQPDYVVNFDRDILPIIKRPEAYKWVANVPTMTEFANPQFDIRDASEANAANRWAYFNYFRVPLLPADYAAQYPTMRNGPAQLFAEDGIPLMPLNSGDNSVTNDGPIYKFLTLSPTQYFYLHQWAAGHFTTDAPEPLPVDAYLDQLDISNCVGAPFSPGIEVTWSVRSPALYQNPMHLRLAHADQGYAHMQQHYAEHGLSIIADECRGGGCEPGDLTKRMAIPWMADFHECTVQTPNITDINVNQLADGSGIQVPPSYYVYWWPPQSPFNVTTGDLTAQNQVLDAYVSRIDEQPVIPAGQNVEYQRGIASAQDMIDSWFMLGFVVNQGTDTIPYLVETERNYSQLAQSELNTAFASK